MIITALVARVAFVTEEPRGLRRSDFLLQFFDFQTDFRIGLHVFSPPFRFGFLQFMVVIEPNRFIRCLTTASLILGSLIENVNGVLTHRRDV